jgi:hypothetical protein
LHAISIDQENPLVHLEVFYVQRGEQLNQFDGFDSQVSVIFVFALAFLLDLKDADELIQEMRPQLP